MQYFIKQSSCLHTIYALDFVIAMQLVWRELFKNHSVTHLAPFKQ